MQSTPRSIFPFLTLPREIRDQIYDDALTTPQAIVRRSWQFNPVYQNSCVCDDPETLCYRNCPRHLGRVGVEHHLETRPFQPAASPGLAAGLLRVNKQVHEEAAMVLYGKNEFDFTMGVTTNRISDTVVHQNFIDNVSDVPGRYLRLLRHISLNVQLHSPTVQDARQSARECRLLTGRLEAIVKQLSEGGGHELRRLVARVDELWMKEGPRIHLIGFVQKVVEPLEALRGIRAVKIEGVKPERAEKMAKAMMGDVVVCEGQKRKREDEDGDEKETVKKSRR